LWQGWHNGALHFTDAKGEAIFVTPDATLLALGGASWPRLGSDGGWVKILASQGVEIAPLKPANCGFIVPWSDYFRERFAGNPLKPVTLTHNAQTRQGEVMITAQGLEGGAIYALSSFLREFIAAQGTAELQLDLRPGVSLPALTQKLQAPRGNKSMSSYLRRSGLSPLAIALLRETISSEQLTAATPAELAGLLKALPLTLTATAGVARAISTAGGIRQASLNENFMLTAKQGVFAAGEMLDWEAPTGGYLLQACFTTGVAAAQGIVRFLQ
jgi:uncharacterized flavoprotein (TIGR03862 family)